MPPAERRTYYILCLPFYYDILYGYTTLQRNKKQIDSSSLGLIPQRFLCSEFHILKGFDLRLRNCFSLCEMTKPEVLYKRQMSVCELGLFSEPNPSVQFQTRLQAPKDQHCQPLLLHINNPFWPSASASCQVHICSAIQTNCVKHIKINNYGLLEKQKK